MFLVIQILCAPATVRAGCSHLVTSRIDSARLPSILSIVVGDHVQPMEERSLPQPPRPCSGAFCSGQPATPAVPAGWLGLTVDAWVWCPANLCTFSMSYALVSTENAVARPILQGSGVFHPPRNILSA